jgi:catechol 2,3-dioxygenase-like lactoylglutathione lyase family enzyme
MDAVEKYLEDMKIGYVRAMVEENGVKVDQMFFHDPDGFMIEICNCDSLPVILL